MTILLQDPSFLSSSGRWLSCTIFSALVEAVLQEHVFPCLQHLSPVQLALVDLQVNIVLCGDQLQAYAHIHKLTLLCFEHFSLLIF